MNIGERPGIDAVGRNEVERMSPSQSRLGGDDPVHLTDATAAPGSKQARGRRLILAPLSRPRNGYASEGVASASSLAGKAAAADPPIGALRRPRKRSLAYSFVGGSLLGIAACVPIFALDWEEGAGPLALLGSLTLACAGIAMYVRGMK